MSNNSFFPEENNNKEIDDVLDVLELDKEIPDAGEVCQEDDGPIFHDAEEEFADEDFDALDSDDTEEKMDIKKEIRSWVSLLLITFVCIFVLKNYVIINAKVPTGSMENTIMPEDQLFGNRLAYVFDDPERGDIIFFYFPDDETQKYVKRIIGLPGEKVTIVDAKVYINDSEVPLDEPYLKEEWVLATGPYEFQVPEGCYFVMGDNRNSSKDARMWNNPYVAREKIIGEAGFIYFPFDRIGVVE